MKPRTGILAAALILLTGPAAAEVYRNVDAQGNVTFSDEPSEGSEAVQVKPVTTVTLPKPQNVRETEKLREEVKREGSVLRECDLCLPGKTIRPSTAAAATSSLKCAAHLACRAVTSTK